MCIAGIVERYQSIKRINTPPHLFKCNKSDLFALHIVDGFEKFIAVPVMNFYVPILVLS